MLQKCARESWILDTMLKQNHQQRKKKGAIELNLSECTTKFTTKKHYEYPERMQYLNATLWHPSLGELATARCLQIHGRIHFKNAGDFLEIMDEDSQEMHEFSVGLFDKYSNVRRWLVNGGSKSGSGCWGMELSIGDMLYIEEVKVKGEVCSFFSLVLSVLLDIDGLDF